ncbi:unnamed protein product, partial [Prorocentrum cordatum]
MAAPLFDFFESGVVKCTKRDRAWLMPAVEVLAANGIDGPQDCVEPNVRAATFQLSGPVEGEVALLERAVAKASWAAAQQVAAGAAAPSGSQGPVGALLQALHGGRKPAAHVDIAAGLGSTFSAGLPLSRWPPPRLADWAQGQAPEERRAGRPFAEEIARGVCRARGPDKKQGDLPIILQWCVAFDRWAIVAELAGRALFAASMAHEEVAMQLAFSARATRRSSAIAVFYGEIARRADVSAGLGAFDVAAAAQSQNSAIVLEVGHAPPVGAQRCATRGREGGSDCIAGGGEARGRGKEHKGNYCWQGRRPPEGAAGGSQAPVAPSKCQKRR